MPKLYRQHSNSLIQREIMDECVVLNKLSGNVHQLNPTAACIWRNLADDIDIESIAAVIVQEFGIEFETALRDAKIFLDELSALGLLEELIK